MFNYSKQGEGLKNTPFTQKQGFNPRAFLTAQALRAGNLQNNQRQAQQARTQSVMGQRPNQSAMMGAPQSGAVSQMGMSPGRFGDVSAMGIATNAMKYANKRGAGITDFAGLNGLSAPLSRDALDYSLREIERSRQTRGVGGLMGLAAPAILALAGVPTPAGLSFGGGRQGITRFS